MEITTLQYINYSILFLCTDFPFFSVNTINNDGTYPIWIAAVSNPVVLVNKLISERKGSNN